MTLAEFKIRSMSDDELIEYLVYLNSSVTLVRNIAIERGLLDESE